VPLNLLVAIPPATLTVPLAVPVAPANRPVPPTIVSFRSPENGCPYEGLGRLELPGYCGFEKTSYMTIVLPSANVSVRTSHVLPHAWNSMKSCAYPSPVTSPLPLLQGLLGGHSNGECYLTSVRVSYFCASIGQHRSDDRSLVDLGERGLRGHEDDPK
jgi:hypothetical protein